MSNHCALKKVACNSTNSAAIDNEGNLYVWGTSKYGLCGAQEAKKESTGKKKAKKEDKKTVIIDRPQQCRIIQNDNLDMFSAEEKESCTDDGQSEVFSAFSMLDPCSSSEQVYYCTHVSYGQYHAGVVCNDVSTNYDFAPLPGSQRELLEEFKEYLLRCWQEQEKQDAREVQLLQIQYYKSQERFQKGQRDCSAPGAKLPPGKGPNAGGSQAALKKGEVSLQLKIEFMLRHLSRPFLKTTFPFVPLQFLKDLMVKQAKMSFKDAKSVNKLFSHFVSKANKVLNAPGFRAKRSLFRDAAPSDDDFINLKELRDQILGMRCSNGRVFMLGVANEGRLGVYFPEMQEQDKDADLLSKGL